MTAPIRSMTDLVEAVRAAQIDRELSYEVIDALSGLQSGYTAKILGPAQSKRLGPVSTFPLLGALGKALVLVDDEEQIVLVKGRWKKRNIVGGSARQLKKRAASSIEQETPNTPENIEDLMRNALQARMREIGMKGNKSPKRRAKMMAKRARQAKATHAARKRWSKGNAGNHQQG
ncbi:hypothetical protein ACVWZ4_000011 [Bradyrhizobium sp. USDA 4472]